MPEFTRFQVIENDGVTILRLLDTELSDLAIQDDFAREITSVLAGDQPIKLVINCALVDYCTTGIINALLDAKHRVVEKQGEFRLCELRQHVRDAFETLNLVEAVFSVLATEADAVASFEP